MAKSLIVEGKELKINISALSGDLIAVSLGTVKKSIN